MPSQRDKWNRHYKDTTEPGQAVWVLNEFENLLPASGKALDLACGTGANSLFMAKRGLDVTAWDISDLAIEKLDTFASQTEQSGVRVHAETRNVELNPPEADSFDVIVVARFLYRPICPSISDALRTGGLLFYQTFTRAGLEISQKGPTNPDYLLKDNELAELFPELTVMVALDPNVDPSLNKGPVNSAADLEPLSGQACLVAQKP